MGKKVLKSIDSCENFAHLGSEDASGDPQYSSRVHLRDQIVTILHAMNDRSMKPGGTMLPISFNIREFLLENGVDLEEMDRFETQQRQADLKNKKHAYFLNVRQLATHFEAKSKNLIYSLRTIAIDYYQSYPSNDFRGLACLRNLPSE